MGSRLLQLDISALVISVMLPKNNEALSDSIKFALKHYFAVKKSICTNINITIELNKWMPRSKAVKQIQYMHVLLNEFFIYEKRPTPPCQLAILEHEKFVPIALSYPG